MYARLRGTTLFFDVEGAGLVPDGPRMRERPAALVVHGGPGSDHSGFKPTFSALADAMQLVYLDQRGQGRSARDGDPERYTLDENVEDLEALRRHLGLGPVAVIGTSYGGMVAMAHAARHPGSVSRLVLVATAAHAGFIARARELLAERGTPEQRATVARCWDQGFASEEDIRQYHLVTGPLYARRFDRAAAEIAHARVPYAPEPLNRAFGPDGFLRRFDLRPELPRITAPTLILAGRHDWICAPEFSEEINALIPGSRLEIFERSGHSLRSDEPDRLIATIRRFLAG
ncbi:MAG: alpha/beta fold hydrolase [Acetobacteraceae bacterium]